MHILIIVAKGGMLVVYLDHSATTKVSDEVMETFTLANESFWANSSSLHNFGAIAEQVVIKASRQILELVNASNHQVIYTSGATESNNLAIKGLVKKDKVVHIITSKIEHPSVLEVVLELANANVLVSYLDVTKKTEEIIKQLETLITKDTVLVSLMHVNSEMGLILPVKEIGEVIAKHPRIKYHVDAVQSIGKLDVNVDDFNIDLLSISAHKIHGIKGVGALIKRREISLIPQIIGGGQMDGARSGTVNVAGAATLAKAMRMVMANKDESFLKIKRLFDYTREELAKIKEVKINSIMENQSPFIINFVVTGVKGETMVHALEEKKVFISAKSACSSKSKKASYVLLALGFDEQIATESLRISFTHTTTIDEIDIFLKALKTSIDAFKK